MIIINHASINAEESSSIFFSLLQTLSTRDILCFPCSSGVFASLA